MRKQAGKTRRMNALLFICPTCEAQPGFMCRGRRGIRKAMHKDRIARRDMLTIVRARDAFAKTWRGKSMNFFVSDEWRSLRYQAIKKHGGACQCCGARPSKDNPLHVDHIKPRSKFPELELDINNLQVLCQDCNLGKGARDQTDWRAA